MQYNYPCTQFFRFLKKQKERDAMKKKYIHYNDRRVFAIHFKSNNTLYYNLNYFGTSHIIVMK